MTKLLIIFLPLGYIGRQTDYITSEIEVDLDQSYKKISKNKHNKKRKVLSVSNY